MDKYIKKFWMKVNKLSNDGCWNWTGTVNQKGYGMIGCRRLNIGVNSIGAHRFSWLINIGEIPKGMWVLHKCDNKLCVNPNHLYLGDHLDNVKDAIKRSPTGKTTSRFSIEDVSNIKNLYSTGGYTYDRLSMMYNCTPAYIWKIVKNKVKLFEDKHNVS